MENRRACLACIPELLLQLETLPACDGWAGLATKDWETMNTFRGHPRGNCKELQNNLGHLVDFNERAGAGQLQKCVEVSVTG